MRRAGDVSFLDSDAQPQPRGSTSHAFSLLWLRCHARAGHPDVKKGAHAVAEKDANEMQAACPFSLLQRVCVCARMCARVCVCV